MLANYLQSSTSEKVRKRLVLVSISLNIGLLAIFKYFNFFIESFSHAIVSLGFTPLTLDLNILLPVGISFYTFQTLSYTIDVYRNKITATKNLLHFLCFVSFFPQLVAGPIEKAKNLLPQFNRQRTFNYNQISDGLKQVLWGFAKKLIIADNLTSRVDFVFSNYENLNGSAILLGGTLFSIQLYCDFSGYSDIAIGTAKTFGFKLSTNFKYPYFTKSIISFWKKWHISLNQWILDYLYIPLGGSKASKFEFQRNVLIIFTLSGLWHGANFTYIIWGALHGLIYLICHKIRQQNIRSLLEIYQNKYFIGALNMISVIQNFFLLSLLFMIFRSPNFSAAVGIFKILFVENLFKHPGQLKMYFNELQQYPWFYHIALFFIIEWFGRKKEYPLKFSREKTPVIVRWVVYTILLCLIITEGAFSAEEFIYFNF